MKIRNAMSIGVILLSIQCFAVNPADMEPNTWYDMIPAGQMAFDVLVDPQRAGFFYGLSDDYNSVPIRSSDEGKTWSIMSVGIAEEHLSYTGHLTSNWRNGQFNLYFTFSAQTGVTTIYKSVDRAESWSFLRTYEAFSDLYISPHDGVFYASRINPDPEDPNRAIILRSTDEGLQWTIVYYAPSYFSHMANSPTNPNVIFGGNPNSGTTMIQWSTNNGLDWTGYPNSINLGYKLNGVVPHPVDPSILIALKWVPYYTEYPMKITRNGGASWENFGPRVDSDRIEDSMLSSLYIDPDNPNLMIGAGTSTSACFRSIDGGTTWTKVLNGNIYWENYGNNVQLLTSAANPSTIYLNRYVMMKSSDTGVSWIAMSPTAGDGKHVGWISRRHPGLMFFFDFGVGRFRSMDYGESWMYQPNPDLDIFPETYTMTESIEKQEIYYIEGYAAGYTIPQFKKSHDFGLTWKHLQPDLTGLLFHVSCSVNLDQRLFGVVDNGKTNLEENRSWVAVSDDGGNSFREIQIPGVIRVHDVCDQAGLPDVWYVLGIHDNHDVARVYKTLDGGVTWQSIGNDTGFSWTGRKEIAFTQYGIFKIDSQNPSTMYVLWGGLWKSIDGGMQWKQKSTFNYIPVKTCFFIDPNSSNCLYLSDHYFPFSRSHSIRSVDAGDTWSVSELWPASIAKPDETSQMIYSMQTMQKMKISTSPPTISMSGYGTTNLQNSVSSDIQLLGWGMDHDNNDFTTGIFLFWQGSFTGYSFSDEYPEGSGLFFSVVPEYVEEPGCHLFEMRAMDRFGELSHSWPFLTVR